MSVQQGTPTRLHCQVPGCTSSFGRKAEFLRHEEEKHGEMKFCSQPGCDYPGTKRASRLKGHMEKKHPELYDVRLDVLTHGLSNARPEVIDRTQLCPSSTTSFNVSSANGANNPVSPCSSTSPAIPGCWVLAVYKPNTSAAINEQTTHCQSTQHCKLQACSAWPLAYYPGIAHDSVSRLDFNPYNAVPMCNRPNDFAQDLIGEGWGNNLHYSYQ